MDKMLGPDFTKGMNKLKIVCEARTSWPRIEEKTMPEQIAILVRDSAGPKTYEKVMGKGYGELMLFIKSNKLKCIGHPFAVYVKYDTLTMSGVIDMGFTVEKPIKAKAGFVLKTAFPECGDGILFGPYDKTGDTYRHLHQYIQEAELQVVGGPCEIYINDPMTEKDPAKLETDILFPVK